MKDKILVNLSEDANHTFESSDNIIGREGEDGTTRLEITIPEKLIGCSVYLDFEKPDGEKLKTLPLNTESGKAVYDVDGYLLTKYGEIKVQAVLTTNDGKIWKSSKKKYHIQKSINADGEIPDKEGFIDEANKILEELSKIVEITKGVGIESIEYENSYTSNDGKIVDIYKINLTDGKKQTFEVTNGKDGKDGEKGEKGEKGNLTIDGRELNFFIGTQDEYDELTDAEKENLFAIIEDDDTAEEIDGLKDDVVGLKNGSVTAKKAECDGNGDIISESYVRKDEKKLYNSEVIDKAVATSYRFEIGKLPSGKTVNDIVGIGLNMRCTSTSYEEEMPRSNIRFSAIRTDNPVVNNGEHILPFFATCAIDTWSDNPASASVYAEIYADADGTSDKLYIRFCDGFYSFNKKDIATGNTVFYKARIGENINSTIIFKLNKVYWLFA